jgi:hypothetical protein
METAAAAMVVVAVMVTTTEEVAEVVKEVAEVEVLAKEEVAEVADLEVFVVEQMEVILAEMVDIQEVVDVESEVKAPMVVAQILIMFLILLSNSHTKHWTVFCSMIPKYQLQKLVSTNCSSHCRLCVSTSQRLFSQ